MAKMKENTYKVFEYVKAHEDENITAENIKDALGFESVRQVNGIITAAFQRHREEIDGEKVIVPLMVRVDGEVVTETEDGKTKHKDVRFIKMTDAGRAFEAECE